MAKKEKKMEIWGSDWDLNSALSWSWDPGPSCPSASLGALQVHALSPPPPPPPPLPACPGGRPCCLSALPWPSTWDSTKLGMVS